MSERDATYFARERGESQEGEPVDADDDVFAGEGYEGVATAVMAATVQRRKVPLILNVPNRGAIGGLRDDDVVEVTCLADEHGAHPLAQGAMPEAALALVGQVKLYERLTVTAAVEGSYDAALGALLAHPLVASYPSRRPSSTGTSTISRASCRRSSHGATSREAQAPLRPHRVFHRRVGMHDHLGHPPAASGSPATNRPVTSPSPHATGIPGATGQIAVLDEGGTLTSFAADGSDAVVLARSVPDQTLIRQPAWSPDGAHLAWVAMAADGTSADVMTAAPDGARPTDVPVGSVPFYLSWDPTSARIGYLGNSPSVGIELGLVDVATSTYAPLDDGSPFYVSWAPTGKQLLVHVGTDRLDRLAIDGSHTSSTTNRERSPRRFGPRTGGPSSTRRPPSPGNGSSRTTSARVDAKCSRDSKERSRSS